MKLNKIHLYNFKGVKDACMETEGKSVILYGINGKGKTTFLDACNIIFSKIMCAAAMDETLDIKNLEASDVRIGSIDSYIEADIDVLGEEFQYYRKRKEGRNRHSTEKLTKIVECIQKKYIGSYYEEEEDDENTGNQNRLKIDDKSMPIYVFYDVNRKLEHRKRLRKKIYENNKMEAWRDAIESSVNYQAFFDWFRGRQEYENSRQLEDETYEDMQLCVVKQGILQMLGEEYKDIRIRIEEGDTEPQLVIKKDGIFLSMNQLSEGERGIISLMGDLCRRLVLANPSMENPLLGEGMVLIDEVDLHLHPAWQGKVVPAFMRIFPNIQFIFTTHAPKVLGEISDGVVIYKLAEDAEKEIVLEKIPMLHGRDVNEILENYMDTDSLSLETKNKIDQMFDAIDCGRYEEGRQLIDELEQLTDCYNTAVVRAKVRLAKKEAYDKNKQG